MAKSPTAAPKRKPRGPQKPYERKPRKPKDAPKTSAQASSKHQRTNLTLHDWLTVVAFADDNPQLNQHDIVEHFKNRKEDKLLFNQASLSRHLSVKGRANDQARLNSNPTTLSGKRVRIVTRPDVEQALYKWVRHMEEKNEHVTGPMLIAKRAVYEKMLNVPEEERLETPGWLTGFTKAYVIAKSPFG